MTTNPSFSVFSVSDMQLIEHKQHPTQENKKKRSHVKAACVPCREAHSACDEKRPCTRCVKRGHPEACIPRWNENESSQNETKDEEIPRKRQKVTRNASIKPSGAQQMQEINIHNLNLFSSKITQISNELRDEPVNIEESKPALPTENKNTELETEDIPKNIQNILSTTNTIVSFCKDLANKLDSLFSEIRTIKKDINNMQKNQKQLQYSLNITQKQMLFLLHCPAFPLESGEPAIAVWDYETHLLKDFNDKFENIVEYTRDFLMNNFSFMQLVPDFFRPFANDFVHEMNQNLLIGKDPKVAQMMYVQSASGKEQFVHLSAQPQFANDKPIHIVTLIRKVAYQTVN